MMLKRGVVFLSSLNYSADMKEIIDEREIDKSILKQAIRDLASKNDLLTREAVDFFVSDEFSNLCVRLGIEKDITLKSIRNLADYPVLPKKKLAEEMARMLDRF